MKYAALFIGETALLGCAGGCTLFCFTEMRRHRYEGIWLPTLGLAGVFVAEVLAWAALFGVRL